MMRRILGCSAALGAAIALAGCNETADGAMAGPVASAPPEQTALALPPGAACSKEIDRYETVVKADLATGNVEQIVYDQIQSEMTRAASACANGSGGEAHAMVVASKAKHGYRA